MRARELPCAPAQLLGPRAVRGGRVSLPRSVHRRGVRGARTPSTPTLTLTLTVTVSMAETLTLSLTLTLTLTPAQPLPLPLPLPLTLSRYKDFAELTRTRLERLGLGCSWCDVR